MPPEPDPDHAAPLLAAVAAEAGRYLAGVADRHAGRIVKADGTPATAADLEAERLITARLAVAFPDIPVVGEESRRPARGAALFFLVDPLDGTSDYLAGSGEYSVNIALIAGNQPIAAALAAPDLDRVWAAGTRAVASPMGAAGAAFLWTTVAVRPAPPEGLVALGSRRHGDPETARCLRALPVRQERAVSSAAKLGLIASGEADIYVRCGPTMEWDIAAGHHILARAGGTVIGPDGRPPTYGHAERGYLNGPFAALGDPSLAGRVPLPERAVNPRRDRAGG